MNGINTKKPSAALVIVAFATVYIVWGSTYFFIQEAIKGFPPLALGAIRFILSGSIMLAWTAYKKERLFVKEDMKHAAISGLLMLFIGTGAVIWVEQFIPSAMVAIMVSAGPLWVILLDKPRWKENFTSKTTVIGLLVGFAGVIVLFWPNIAAAFSSTGDAKELAGLFILVLSSMAWSGGSLYSKYRSTGNSIAVNSAWQMLAAGVAFIPAALLHGEAKDFHWSAVTLGAWFALFYLVIFGSIAAFSAYVWLLKVRTATQVSTHAYVNPVVAVLLGVFFANEQIGLVQILGLVIILGSVLMVSMVKYRNNNKVEKDKTKEKVHIAVKNEKQLRPA